MTTESKILAFQSLKSQIRRRHIRLVILIIALSLATIVGLFNINLAVRSMEVAESNYHAQLFRRLDLSSKIGDIEISFNDQKLEWRNVLLRGHDPLLYQKHWLRFQQMESRVDVQLDSLRDRSAQQQDVSIRLSDASPLPAGSTVDSLQKLRQLENMPFESLSIQDKISTLIAVHKQIGAACRNELTTHPLGLNANNAFQIDRQLLGVDRWMSDKLLEVHQQLTSSEEMKAFRSGMTQQDMLKNLRDHIERGIAWISLILVALFFLLADRFYHSEKALDNITRQADATIYQLAYSDSLTGLSNRHHFQERLKQIITASMRTGSYGGLIFLDLDNFKTLNDTEGHAVGDLLLIEVAQRLKSNVRATDTVARLGGDEFVVILDTLHQDAETAREKAGIIAQKIGLALAQPYHLKNHTHYGSASIGVALFHDGIPDRDELLKRADTAMYRAKEAGRHTVRFYDHDTHKALETRGYLTNGLYTALNERQFELHYQVQVDRYNKPVGAEALLRWHHPEFGVLYPDQFIEIAEENDLIVEIGNWVLNAACEQIRRWSSSSLTSDLVISINVSAAQLRISKHVNESDRTAVPNHVSPKPTLIEVTRQALQTTGINPALLKFEITETLAVQDIEFTIATMMQFKALGVSLALDDFGTAHASLGNLKSMPIDQIKIDQSFIQNIANDDYDKAIVKSIIDLADKLHIGVIAEGIDTQEQKDLLISKGCYSFQGYLFGKAMPATEFESWLADHSA